MKDGVCPKCGSSEIFVPKEGGGIGGRDHQLGIRFGGPTGTWDWVTYLCVDCGYYENYVTDSRMLEGIRTNPQKAHWRRLNG